MELKGKFWCGLAGIFIGDLIGLPLGGLIGFVVGGIIGHYYFDQNKREDEGDSAFKAYQRRQGIFIYHVFSLCAKLAKADGAINRNEIHHMEMLMRQQFRMNDAGRVTAIQIWKQAKASDRPFDHYAQAFYKEFHAERHQVLNMLDLLFAMAAADGGLHLREEELLLRAAGIFHIGRMKYDDIKGRHFQAAQQAMPRWDALDPYYSILGAKPKDSMDDIKQKFRQLALKWHPDRVIGSGASTEAQRHAKEKFQQINEAYEKINAARKVL